MPDMDHREMVRVMGMDDRQPYHRVLLDQLEGRWTESDTSAAWDGELYWGGDYNKVALKSEGESTGGKVIDARAELAWDHIISRWWSGQLGVRHDWGTGPERDWAAAGVRGLAPYFFDVEATFYLGEDGRTALRFTADYDLLLTQRLILQPRAGLNAYGKDDPARELMSGLADIEIGVRLRYEFRREVAPYLGISWASALGETADLQRANGADPGQWQVLAGVRITF
jgi:copper resistance protein B